MTSVRWGILSTARIGVEKVIPAIKNGANCEVVGIASRSEEKARNTADRLGPVVSAAALRQTALGHA